MFRFKNHYVEFFDHVKENRGVFGTRPFIAIAAWWPVTTIGVFGSYFYSGDPRPLGSYIWVWEVGRFVIVALSVLCLVFRSWASIREWLGHAIAIYAFCSMTAYWLAIHNHDKVFRGQLIRIGFSSLAFYFLTILSFAIIKANNERKELQSRGLEPVG